MLTLQVGILYLQIPLAEFELSFVRSSGPGGQNVNKVNSKAVLRWNLLSSSSLPEHIRQRLLLRLAHQLTSEGEILLTSDQFRDQIRNRTRCLEKLTQLLEESLHVPKPRKDTHPSRSRVMKNKVLKNQHSQKKAQRRKSHHED